MFLLNQQDVLPQQAIYVLKQSDGSHAGRYTVDDPERVILQSLAFAEI